VRTAEGGQEGHELATLGPVGQVTEKLGLCPQTGREWRLGLIGAGRIAAEGHLPALARLGITPRAILARTRDRSTRLAAEYGIPLATTDLGEFLDQGLDVVVVATPPDQRVDAVCSALRSGAHVFVEKPLATTMAAGHRMVAASEEANRRLAVCQNMRHAPAFELASDAISSGRLGSVRSVLHLFDDDGQWMVSETSRPTAPPHLRLFDFATHWFDITRRWFGAAPATVSAQDHRAPFQPSAAREPWAFSAKLLWDDGREATLHAPGCSVATPPGYPFFIWGDRGVIRGSVYGADFFEIETNGVRHRSAVAGEWFGDSFVRTITDFIVACGSAAPPDDVLATLRLTLAACRSADESGRPVAI
jgi:predicted dehydrogenase